MLAGGGVGKGAGGCEARLATFDRPFVTAVAEHEESFDALAPLLQATIPGAQGQPHTTIPAAAHYIQEHAPDEMVALVTTVTAGR